MLSLAIHGQTHISTKLGEPKTQDFAATRTKLVKNFNL